MKAWVLRGFALLLLALPFVAVIADDPHDVEIARLVKQLGSSEYRTREAATKRLTEIGEPALDALGKAKDTLEMRRRAEAISAVIENKICVEQLRLTGHKQDPKYRGWGGVFPTVSVSADGKRLLSSGYFDPTLRLWDTETGKELRVLEGNTSPVLGAALSPDGTRALSACLDNSVRLWDATTGKVLHQMAGHGPNGAWSAAFGPKGQGLSGGADGTMILWDLNTGAKAGVFTCHPKPMMAVLVWVAYLEKAKLAATSGTNQPIRLWDLETGKVVRTITTDTSASFNHSACFSPDGKRLATCHNDGAFHIWDVATGKELLKFRAPACCVAFSPDGNRIVTGAANGDNMVRVWDATTGKELRKYEGHTDVVACVTFFPDGKRIASASIDGTARIWGAPR